MVNYRFNEKKQFIIEDYHKAKTFASFLPGIAGIDGIPMWAYYVNRGQCMGSFGVRDKDSTIMEFLPANIMYKYIELNGFRTFIKLNGEIHEIFSSYSKDEVKRKLYIEKNVLKLEEINKTLGLTVRITYFTMPKENFAALVRKVEIENLSNEPKEIELLDGLVQILPFGVKNNDYQSMANLFKAWFDIFNLEENIAYYKVRATTSDSAEVGEVNRGNFYASFSSESNGLIKPIVDMDVIFGYNTSLTFPEGWKGSVKNLTEKTQITINKVSGGFTAEGFTLKEKYVLCTLIGHVSSPESVNSRKSDFTLEYIERKQKEATDLVEELLKDTATETSQPILDEYVNQCYLDNILRGGYPLILKTKEKNFVYHVYSRKHGDLEREYNFFSLEPAYYSQGNGNFRDVNQNRRNDILFNPEVKDFNVKQFMSLIQADGYNPLIVKGLNFKLREEALEKVLSYVLKGSSGVKELLVKAYTPGKLMTYIEDYNIELKISREEFLNRVLSNSDQSYEAEFGEGYWVDHWTYNMDLVESYLKIYPDKLEEFLFEYKDYRYFESMERILPRRDKYVLAQGKVRQYGAVIEDKEKIERLKVNPKGTNWLRVNEGRGSIYETNLYVKLLSLALVKFSTLDPYGIGIEMEANKPGWNDAMNGLPGIFGSGVNEAAELKRLIQFILEASSNFKKHIKLPVEMAELMEKTLESLKHYNDKKLNDYEYWDRVSSLREAYREKIRFGITGEEVSYHTYNIAKIFVDFSDKLEQGLEKAFKYGDGIYPTYLYYEAENYEVIEGKKSPVNGYDNVIVKSFKCYALPSFLEGPTRVMKVLKSKDKARDLYSKIKQSEIYDKKLKMYKTSLSLEDTTLEIGRARAFTPGWLEREAIFLHMEYKYLLELLNSGLYDEFYEDIKTMLVPFMNPEVYGRSILENSSFIASSVNPDEDTHGRGFVARLSGSTAEMLSIWYTMMVGHKGFKVEKGSLILAFDPILPGWLFKEGKVSFKFLGNTLVNYYNPQKLDTYDKKNITIDKIILRTKEGISTEIKGSIIESTYAEKVRTGEIANIDIYYKYTKTNN